MRNQSGWSWTLRCGALKSFSFSELQNMLFVLLYIQYVFNNALNSLGFDKNVYIKSFYYLKNI